jgi:hypothetical protein
VVASSDTVVTDLEEGRWFRTGVGRRQVWESGGGGEWSKQLREQITYGCFYSVFSSKKMKPTCYKQILPPNIKKIVYEETTRKNHILIHKSYIEIKIVFYFLFSKENGFH